MSAKPSLLKQTVLRKVVQGVEQAGVLIGRIVVNRDGDICIYPRESAKEEVPTTAPAASQLQVWPD